MYTGHATNRNTGVRVSQRPTPHSGWWLVVGTRDILGCMCWSLYTDHSARAQSPTDRWTTDPRSKPRSWSLRSRLRSRRTYDFILLAVLVQTARINTINVCFQVTANEWCCRADHRCCRRNPSYADRLASANMARLTATRCFCHKSDGQNGTTREVQSFH